MDGLGITGTNPPNPCGLPEVVPSDSCPVRTGAWGASVEVTSSAISSPVLTYGSTVADWGSSSTGDGGGPFPSVPGIPGSANVSASEVTSGAVGWSCDCSAVGAGICPLGSAATGLTAPGVAGLSGDSADSGPGILGREIARLGGGSAVDLGGIDGETGLLFDPLNEFRIGQ